MIVEAFASFKKQIIIAVALLGFVAAAKWDAWSMTFNLGSLAVAQVETQTNGNDEKAPSPVGMQSKSKTDEDKQSTGIKEKPLKDFKPSERIEAEQAVDFPYDI